MASISRYFFPNSGTAPVSPSADTSWNDTTQFDRVALGRSHKNETSATKTEVFNGTTPAFVLMRQFVSEPLFAQTIAGHIKGQIRGITSQAAKLGMVAVAVRLVKNDGTDYASPKVLLAPTSADLAATPPFLATTTATNRSFNDAAEGASIALTSQTAVTGDRLVIELGVRDTVAHVSRTLGLAFGGTTVTDLAEDNTTTTANYPWIEFDSSIVMIPYELPRISETITAKRYGDATPDDELIHVSDTVTAAFLLLVTLTETTHVTDTVTAVIPADDLNRSLLETLHLRDGGIATQDGIVRLDGVLRVTDAVTPALTPEQASPSETVHVTDTLTTALTPELASLIETMHVSDSVSVTLNPLEASLSELVHVTEDLTVVMEGAPVEDLSANVSELIHVTDSATPTLAPLDTTASELVHVTDTLTAAESAITITLSETVHVTDTAAGTLTPLATSATETVHVSDSVTASLDTLLVSLSETSHITDTVTPALSVGASLTEAVTVADTLTVAIDLSSSVSELLHVSESVTALLSAIVTSLSEFVHVSDAALTVTLEGEQIIQRRPTTDPGSVGSRSADARMISL